MLTEDRRIAKINGKERFLEVTEFFSAGKVCLQMCTYNKNAAAGQKITSSIRTFLGMEDLAYFAHVLEDEETLYKRMVSAARKNPGAKEIVVASFFSGSTREGQVYSRQLTIEKGTSQPVIIRSRECPGVKTSTGAVVPDKTRRNETVQIIIGLSMEMCYKLASSLKRAINIYDRWTADRVLEERLESIRYKAVNVNENMNAPVNNNQYNRAPSYQNAAAPMPGYSPRYDYAGYPEEYQNLVSYNN